MDAQEIERLLEFPTLSIRDAGRVLGLGINKSYAAARAGEIPIIEFGRKRRVPTAQLRKLLGLSAKAS
jgi:excisionase family DNA binding protein